VLTQWCNRIFIDWKNSLFEAREIIRSVQGLGSGADVAAGVLGGIVAIRTNPLK